MTANFEMRRERHAISDFTANLRLFQSATASAFAEVRLEAEKQAMRLELPAPIQQQLIRFDVGKGAATAQSNSPMPGFGFRSFSRNGEPDTTLMFEPDSMQLSVAEYPGWDQILPQISETFGKSVRPYLEESPAVKGFGLQYINEFRSHSAGLVVTDELFRNSRWLPSFPRGCGEQWHCHTGLFVPINEVSRFLINVNFDTVLTNAPDRPDEATYVKVGIAISLNYDVPGQSPLIVEPDDVTEEIVSHFTRAHMLEKELVREIFADQYVEIMGAANG